MTTSDEVLALTRGLLGIERELVKVDRALEFHDLEDALRHLKAAKRAANDLLESEHLR